MKIKNAIACVVAALSTTSALAQVSSDSMLPDMKDIHGTVGVRAWRVDWATWFDYYDYRNGSLANAVIPVASLRYKNFLVSGSYMARKEIEFPYPYINGNYRFGRSEYDVNAGYMIVPGLVVTAGYKNINYNGSDLDWEAKGPTIGVAGSAPLSSWVSVYGNAAYGRLKLTDSGHTFTKARGKYLLTEVGLAFPLGNFSSTLSSVVATFGYRYQRLGTYPNAPTSLPIELFEYTQGPVAGLSLSF
jgi:hypothetical protein